MQMIRVINNVYSPSYRRNSSAISLGLCCFLAVLKAANVAIPVTIVIYIFLFGLL